jgi:hypothetical protein
MVPQVRVLPSDANLGEASIIPPFCERQFQTMNGICQRSPVRSGARVKAGDRTKKNGLTLNIVRPRALCY